jgi:Tol biopolymer transport system component
MSVGLGLTTALLSSIAQPQAFLAHNRPTVRDALSQKSSRIVMTTEGGKLVSMTSSGTGRRVVLDRHHPGYPQVSPSGRLIVFSCFFGGHFDSSKNEEICSIRSNGTKLRRLTSDEKPDYSPDWSPSGRRIAYVHGHHLMLMSRRGQHARPVPHGANVGSLGWRFSKSIVYERGSGDGGNLFSIRSDGSRKTRLTRKGEGGEMQPQWSPSGRSVVFIRQVGVRYIDVFTIRLGDRDATRVTSNCCTKGFPTWSPSGRRLLYQNGGLRIVPRSGGTEKSVAHTAHVQGEDWALLDET